MENLKKLVVEQEVENNNLIQKVKELVETVERKERKIRELEKLIKHYEKKLKI